jgi:hypothetical protein
MLVWISLGPGSNVSMRSLSGVSVVNRNNVATLPIPVPLVVGFVIAIVAVVVIS